MHKDLSFLKEFRSHDGIVIDLLNDIEISTIPQKPGAYIMFSHETKFIYPEGRSKVIYIGKSDNLYKRVYDHSKAALALKGIPKKDRKQYWHYSRYHFFLKFGCQIIWFTRRGSQNAKDLESDLIDYFYAKYHSLPIGNGAFSFRKS
jgi:excinuclease UvrABC nuclease subunit